MLRDVRLDPTVQLVYTNQLLAQLVNTNQTKYHLIVILATLVGTVRPQV
jgi:hypothetical protein